MTDNLLQGNQLPVEVLPVQRVTQIDILPGAVRARHLEPNTYLIKVGVAADRPTTGDVYVFYFATDTASFSAWNGVNWKSVTLS